jgi:hypothetical protein
VKGKATNLRSVRRNAKGFNTAGRFLCDSCGRKNACFKAPTQQCHDYIVTLKFRDLRGTDGRFATFRSRAWAAIAQPGMRVGICDAHAVVLKRYAVIEAVHVGERGEMERLYGPLSHLCLGQPFDLEAFREMRRRSSGPRIYNSQKDVTVLILR